jgi:hypothetical protein
MNFNQIFLKEMKQVCFLIPFHCHFSLFCPFLYISFTPLLSFFCVISHTPTESQVDVPQGIANFKDTEIELQEVIRNEIGDIEELKEGIEGEVEKGTPNGEIFDLVEYMQTSFKGDQFGGQKKRMGIVFKNLTVVGEGAGMLRRMI